LYVQVFFKNYIAHGYAYLFRNVMSDELIIFNDS